MTFHPLHSLRLSPYFGRAVRPRSFHSGALYSGAFSLWSVFALERFSLQAIRWVLDDFCSPLPTTACCPIRILASARCDGCPRFRLPLTLLNRLLVSLHQMIPLCRALVLLRCRSCEPVQFFSKLNNLFVGYFDPINIFFDNKNI